MRKDLRTVVLVPCILTCILAVLVIFDIKGISLVPAKSKGSKKVAVTVTPTPAAQPTLAHDTVEAPAHEPEPTDWESEIPSVSITPTNAPTPEPTPALTPAPTEAAANNPEHAPSGTPADEQKINFNAVYRADGKNYSLIADKNTMTYLILNKKDNSVRKTGFPFHSVYAEFPGEQLGPIIGHKDDRFVFMSNNKVVASDGIQEEVLLELDEIPNINAITKSENRVLAAFSTSAGQTVCIADLRNFYAEIYYEKSAINYSYMVLTDENFSYSKKRRIPAGPYYEFLYTARDGKVKLLAMVNEITDYTLDTGNNTVTIKTVGNDSFKIDLKTDKLTTSKSISKERTLYLPAYGDGIIENLTDIRFINRNDPDEPVVLKVLPTSYKADVYYNSYYDTFYFNFYLPGKENLLPSSGVAGSFTVIDYSVISLVENKFFRGSTVKNLLFSGQTGIGNAEIYLMEQYVSYNNEYVPFEMVYAWIPIKNSTKAYQIYMYVPYGESHEPYLDFIKQLIS